MNEEELVRYIHICGGAILLGAGIAIAFFMVVARRTRDAALIAHVSQSVVAADFLFTATAMVLQPLTGWRLATLVGWPLGEGWLALSIALYVLTGLFWIPVVFIQLRLRDLARRSAAEGTMLPPEFDRLYRIWFACGCPAFAAVLAIFWLMANRPDFSVF